MNKLLECYYEEGLTIKMDGVNENINDYISNRKLLKVSGFPVNNDLLNKILNELKIWSDSGQKSGDNRERPSIKANS